MKVKTPALEEIFCKGIHVHAISSTYVYVECWPHQTTNFLWTTLLVVVGFNEAEWTRVTF